jgi:predicted MFS family arabinose efflux permease
MSAAAMPTPPPASGRTVLLLAGAAFFSGAALRVCDPLLPRLGTDFGITKGVAGQVIIGFSIAYGLMQLVFGPLGDRFGKPRMMSLALFGCAAGALACAFASDFDALVVLRCFWGMAAAGVIPLAMAWIGDTVAYEHRQATLARFLTGTLSGMMAGQLAGGLYADSAPGWRGAFFTLAAGYLVIGVLLHAHLRRQPPLPAVAGAAVGLRGMAARLGEVLRTPWSRVVLLAVAAEGVFLLGPMAFIPSYLHQRHGISIAAASALAALAALGGLVYALSARHIVARFGERRMALWGGVLMGAGFLAWWALPFWGVAGAVALAVGFGTYLFHNTLQTHATQMAPAVRGTAVSLFAACLFAGQAVGVTLAGRLVDRFGFTPVLLLAALALPLAGIGFARALHRRVQA